jgi:hypothetical protein
LSIGKDSPQLSQIVEVEREGLDRMMSIGLVSGEDKPKPEESVVSCSILRSIDQAPI